MKLATTSLALVCLPLFGQVPGLVATAAGGGREVRFVAEKPSFYLDPEESLHPALPPHFSVTYSGHLTVVERGEFEFSEAVTLNGETRKQFSLTPARYRFSLPHQRRPGVATLRLLWRSDRFPWEPVPASAFSHESGEAPSQLPLEGRLLVEQLGCANCHAGAGVVRSVHALDGIGSRTNENWIRWWLKEPQARMPAVLESAEVADVAAFLMTLKGPAPKASRFSPVGVGKGGELFGILGCKECHVLSGLGSKYTHAALTDFLLSAHRPSMLLNDSDSSALAAYLIQSTNFSVGRDSALGDAIRGRNLMDRCLACHTVPGLTATSPAAPTVDKLKSADCRGARYKLSPGQREQIASFLNEYARQPDRSPAPVFDFPRMLTRERCVQCHKAGSEAPPLEGVGAKLKTSWIGRVLWEKQRIQPHREMRMPHYSQQDLGPYLMWFAKYEGVAPGDGDPVPAADAIRVQKGHGLLGTNPKTQGMACIGCHDWGQNKSLGEEGPQLVNLTERMRFEWYERWMRNPVRILSGTSMPNYFSSMAKDRADDTIRTLWAAMALGAKLTVPEGFRTAESALGSEAKPVPTDRAIVIRWDMPEATPAAIAVGLPGKLSYVFDAGAVQLLYCWSGGFVDMSGTLLRKTDKNKLTPVADLLGEIFWRAKDYPIRVGQQDRIPQRRFKGYRLVEGIPQFHYQVDGIDVWEKLDPLGPENAIRRQVLFSHVEQPVWFEGRPVERGNNVKVEMRLSR